MSYRCEVIDGNQEGSQECNQVLQQDTGEEVVNKESTGSEGSDEEVARESGGQEERAGEEDDLDVFEEELSIRGKEEQRNAEVLARGE